ncbi:MAG: CDP-glycerol glycerophosphotransferase family protein, partial [Thermodesulfobacteriota bacterium]
YNGQVRRLNLWKQYDNVYAAEIDEYPILPFLQSANLLISDSSSTLFEFAALNKPVVWCDFMKLRLFYRGSFRFRYLKRMDNFLNTVI